MMPGYEDLSPEQIIFIVELISIVIIVFCITQLIRTVLTLKISKNVKHLELMIEKKYDDGIKKPGFFESLKVWRVERKKRKEEDEVY